MTAVDGVPGVATTRAACQLELLTGQGFEGEPLHVLRHIQSVGERHKEDSQAHDGGGLVVDVTRPLAEHIAAMKAGGVEHALCPSIA